MLTITETLEGYTVEGTNALFNSLVQAVAFVRGHGKRPAYCAENL